MQTLHFATTTPTEQNQETPADATPTSLFSQDLTKSNSGSHISALPGLQYDVTDTMEKERTAK